MAYEMEAGSPEEPEFAPNFVTRKARTGSRIQSMGTWLVHRQTLTASPVSTGSDDARFEEVLARLRQRIIGTENLKGSRIACWHWYVKYLDERLLQVWQDVVVTVVEGLASGSVATSTASKILVYEILIRMVGYLEDRKELSLAFMTDDLRSKGLIKSDCGHSATQFVFQLTGWLTAFWEPALDASITALSLQQRRGKVSRRMSLLGPAIRSTTISIEEARGPLYRFLNRFGELLPVPELLLRENFRGGVEAGPECISATYLLFHHLQKDLNAKIEWTGTLNQHLEYDQRNNILYVFRFPSICLLMYRDQEGTMASKIFRDWCADYEHEAQPRLRTLLRNTRIEDYFREVLLSYDLVFGRSRHSRAIASKIFAENSQQLREQGLYDPLLETLCTKKRNVPQVREVHDELESLEFIHDVPAEEFPFLWKRLFNLQRISMRQNPHSWRRLWNDRRNMGAWFALWAVVVFGGGTLLLQGIQLVFQILQIWPPSR